MILDNLKGQGPLVKFLYLGIFDNVQVMSADILYKSLESMRNKLHHNDTR